jgi:hypothetical protein
MIFFFVELADEELGNFHSILRHPLDRHRGSDADGSPESFSGSALIPFHESEIFGPIETVISGICAGSHVTC